MTFKLMNILINTLIYTLIYSVSAMVDIEWNKEIIRLIEKTSMTPPIVSRSLSLIYKSMLETYLEIADITNNELYRECGVNEAAKVVIKDIFKNETINVNYKCKGKYNYIGYRRSKFLLQKRKDDYKFINDNKYVKQNEYGKWYSDKISPLLPNFGYLKPMSIKSVYLMPPPPKTFDYYYKKSYNETLKLGSKNSMYRNKDRTEIAYFWEAGKGTCTPPGVWNLIAQKLLMNEHNILKRLYIFSVLNDALFDTAITVWYNKYYYNTWRPNMAFNKFNWEPLLATPPFPEYGSGHSSFSGAGAEILYSFFGKKSFKLEMKNMTRTFRSFYDAAYEAGRSRIYGGIHFEFSNIPFINLGRKIAKEVVKNLKRKIEF